jgi:hypothetical protein
MAETAKERIPGIHDDSIADTRIRRSGINTGEENGTGKSRTTPGHRRSVFSGCENDEGQQYLISYLVSQGMPDKQVALYLLSHAKTTERANRHSFTLMNKISNIHGVNRRTTRSRDETNLCLASMVALARDYVDPTTNPQTPIT